MTSTKGPGLTIAVTGAAGFVGRAVVERIERGALGPVGELRLNDVVAFNRPGATIVVGSYARPEICKRLAKNGVDVLFHLASLPGGASEQQPWLGREVNLDGSIGLIDTVARPQAPIIVYASSIAALGQSKERVNSATALRPIGSYGTHKAMVELYLADLTRRGVVAGRAVRPAGVVARPRDAFAGFATAWMSDLFHAAREGRRVTIPASADAHIWLQSFDVVADNIIHAARMQAENFPAHCAWTLPATVVRLDELVASLSQRTGNVVHVDYGGGPMDQPPLDASDALSLGFISDGDTDALVDAVVSRIESS